MVDGEQVHSVTGSPAKPQGQGRVTLLRYHPTYNETGCVTLPGHPDHAGRLPPEAISGSRPVSEGCCSASRSDGGLGSLLGDQPRSTQPEDSSANCAVPGIAIRIRATSSVLLAVICRARISTRFPTREHESQLTETTLDSNEDATSHVRTDGATR